jgi:hypothetical protein
MENLDNEQLEVIRQHNKALRKVHKTLRRALKFAVEYNDNLFLELCNSDKEAELAMEELWARGNFKCGPRDYRDIVEACLTALAKPIDQRSS